MYIFLSQYFEINVNSFVNPTSYKDNTTVEKYVSFLSPRLIFITQFSKPSGITKARIIRLTSSISASSCAS